MIWINELFEFINRSNLEYIIIMDNIEKLHWNIKIVSDGEDVIKDIWFPFRFSLLSHFTYIYKSLATKSQWVFEFKIFKLVLGDIKLFWV